MAHIPHMGGKQAIAKNLIDVMLFHNPEADTFVDVFGGGGSMSFEALSRPQIKRVIYNELNTGTVALMDKVLADGVTPEFYEWISRERFHELVNGDCWRAGLVKNLWSFGNNQRSYLYGEDIEAIKKLGHDVVVNRCDVAANLFGVSLDAIESPTVNERRLKFCKERKRITKKMNLLEHLTRLQHLEHLEHLERLPTHGLITSNKSYEQLDLSKYDKDKTVIYLDPPYQNCDATISKSQYMKDYIENKCNIDHFSSLGFTVYLSEYKNPNPELWQEVLNIEKRVTMSATNNKLKKIEKLYVNHD